VVESGEPAWRRDIDDAYKLFARKHVDRLTSRQLLEAALGGMRSSVGSAVAMPVFSDVAEVVTDDLAHFNASTDELLRESPEVSTDALRSSAIEAMVKIHPDGHTVYWPVLAECPVRDLVEGRCEVRSEVLQGGIGYIWWSGWVLTDTFDILAELRSRMDALLRDGAKAWLFDVRGNRGGWGARHGVGMFVDGEAVVRTSDRDGQVEVAFAERSRRLPSEYQLPIAVAVDSGSWSASEIFAFALRAAGRATIVGERTAGFVGSIEAIEISGEGRVGVKVQNVTGPNGEMYNGVGVKPDIETTSADAVDAAARQLREELAPVLT
jgi:hypothetical protein